MSGGRDPKRVVLLGSYAPSLILFRGPLISELVRRGHNVYAMAPDIGGAVRAGLVELGAIPVDVPVSNSSLNPVSAARTLRALGRSFKDINPDTLIAYTVKPVTLGSIAAARAGVPNIVALVTGLGFAFTEGGGVKRRLSRVIASALYKIAFRRCSAIIFQNEDDRAVFEELRLVTPPMRTTVVNGSGIDLDRFKVVPISREARFLMIARLLGDKGVREYVAAAASLKRRYPNVPFRLVGYRDQSPDALSQAEVDEMGRQGVEFLGRREDVRAAIADSSVYVLPSYREGTPRSVLEAMAMGRPVVTTDVAGCRQTVQDGLNGFLVPARDSQRLAAAMEKFILDPLLIQMMGAGSRQLAERKYDVHKVNDMVIGTVGL